MTKLGDFFKATTVGIFNNRTKPENWGNSFFYPLMGSTTINWSGNEFLKDFLEVPEISAVVCWKYRAFSNMKLSVVSRVTGQEVSNQEPVVRRLRKPNYFQSQKEFLMQTKAFQEIFGNEFLYFVFPYGMPRSVSAIYSIPPQIVDISVNDRNPYFLSEDPSSLNTYKYTWEGREAEFLPDSIVHINKPKVNIKPGNFLKGESPMIGLQPNIRNLRAAYEARNVLIENRGALGILSNAAQDGTGAMLPIDPDEKKKLQDEFTKYGLTKSQWQVIITNLALNWQQMSIDADKLQLYEECREDFTRICDKFGVNYELFGSQKGVTFANKQQAEKNSYQDTIIPEALEWGDALNRRFETENRSWYIKVSFDHLPIFQEDIQARATSLNTLVDALQKAVNAGFITTQQAKDELKNYNL